MIKVRVNKYVYVFLAILYMISFIMYHSPYELISKPLNKSGMYLVGCIALMCGFFDATPKRFSERLKVVNIFALIYCSFCLLSSFQ